MQRRALARRVGWWLSSLGAAALVGVHGVLAAPAPADASTPPEGPGTVTPVTAPLRYDFDYPTIGYAGRASHNQIARLQARIDRGEVKLQFRGERGYLDSLLAALHIDPSSQILVYSKTSLQIDHITAATPRAIYFNDDSYVAWVQDSNLLEMSVMDSELGAVFYTLVNKADSPVNVHRETSRCLACHDTFSMTGGGVPRFLISSTLVDTTGVALRNETSHETDDTTPLERRWGGWYVTGVPDHQMHLGNVRFERGATLPARNDYQRGTMRSIDALFDTRPYLTDKSDVVALLVLEHQLYIKNLITRLNFKSRSFLARDAAAAAPRTVSFDTASAGTQTAVHRMVEQLVRAMLFADAASYRAPLAGTSGFDHWFMSQGRRDSQGRSLRDFDLRTRLFKYPLSYVIYSEAFDALPAPIKQKIYARLREILSASQADPAVPKLTAAQRRAILEILTATKPDFARATT
ncbi:MAG TPA: hypothetical protein VLW26_04780 [Steroidobacteraceae bacterium]|nr:hypothetical protein [Steroidobacteraceae bacterium]